MRALYFAFCGCPIHSQRSGMMITWRQRWCNNRMQITRSSFRTRDVLFTRLISEMISFRWIEWMTLYSWFRKTVLFPSVSRTPTIRRIIRWGWYTSHSSAKESPTPQRTLHVHHLVCTVRRREEGNEEIRGKGDKSVNGVWWNPHRVTPHVSQHGNASAAERLLGCGAINAIECNSRRIDSRHVVPLYIVRHSTQWSHRENADHANNTNVMMTSSCDCAWHASCGDARQLLRRLY